MFDHKPISTAACAPVSTKTARVGERRRILKAASIAYGGLCVTVPCTVRDVSASGARLAFDALSSVPDTFRLTIELDGLVADCEVVWRRGLLVGVRFLAPPLITPPKRVQVVGAAGAPGRPTLRRQGR